MFFEMLYCFFHLLLKFDLIYCQNHKSHIANGNIDTTLNFVEKYTIYYNVTCDSHLDDHHV